VCRSVPHSMHAHTLFHHAPPGIRGCKEQIQHRFAPCRCALRILLKQRRAVCVSPKIHLTHGSCGGYSAQRAATAEDVLCLVLGEETHVVELYNSGEGSLIPRGRLFRCWECSMETGSPIRAVFEEGQLAVSLHRAWEVPLSQHI
jgi:hypothetical protein